MLKKKAPTKVPEFVSTYGLLDVMKGRKKLQRYLGQQGPVKLLIEATLSEPNGSDDGTSIEFQMTVTKVSVVE